MTLVQKLYIKKKRKTEYILPERSANKTSWSLIYTYCLFNFFFGHAIHVPYLSKIQVHFLTSYCDKTYIKAPELLGV
jgi:hypothetical protein